MKPDLQKRLQEAFPAITDDHFAYHATDLYVVSSPEVCNWMSENYEHFGSVAFFISQPGSGWAGAGKQCIDIPFAGVWPKGRHDMSEVL